MYEKGMKKKAQRNTGCYKIIIGMRGNVSGNTMDGVWWCFSLCLLIKNREQAMSN